jgi:hypothetical protein
MNQQRLPSIVNQRKPAFKPTGVARLSVEERKAKLEEQKRADQEKERLLNAQKQKEFVRKPRKATVQQEAGGIFSGGIGASKIKSVSRASASGAGGVRTQKIIMKESDVARYDEFMAKMHQGEGYTDEALEEIEEHLKPTQLSLNPSIVPQRLTDLLQEEGKVMMLQLPPVLPPFSGEQGQIGHVVLRKSGKVELHLNSAAGDSAPVIFDLMMLPKKQISQHAILFNHKGTPPSATNYGPVEHSLVATPSLSSE